MTAMLPVALAAALAFPPGFVPPNGWSGDTPPADSGIARIWLPPNFHANKNGDNFTMSMRPVQPGANLDDDARQTAHDVSQERLDVKSHATTTCRGLQPAWEVTANLPMGEKLTIEQIYHLTIAGGIEYTFIFTHKLGDPIPKAIADSLASICPSNPAT